MPFGTVGKPDNIDPDPRDPGIIEEILATILRDRGDLVADFELDLFDAPSANAAKGRRNATSNKLNSAANAVTAGDTASAIESLMSLLAKIDGQSPPPDWMDDSPEKTALAVDVVLLIALLLLE